MCFGLAVMKELTIKFLSVASGRDVPVESRNQKHTFPLPEVPFFSAILLRESSTTMTATRDTSTEQ